MHPNPRFVFLDCFDSAKGGTVAPRTLLFRSIQNYPTYVQERYALYYVRETRGGRDTSVVRRPSPHQFSDFKLGKEDRTCGSRWSNIPRIFQIVNVKQQRTHNLNAKAKTNSKKLIDANFKENSTELRCLLF